VQTDVGTRGGDEHRASEATQPRFAFGTNWRAFLDVLDERRIAEAEKSLCALLGRDRLAGLSFLDIGSGSGLFSLAARRLGARVHSFDYDPDSVACTATLRERYFPGEEEWTVGSGSALDADYLASLGNFDVVYAWGVLHHTGAMWQAIENAAACVAPGGLFYFALYRRTPLCRAWAWEKRWYAQASPAAQRRARQLYIALIRIGLRVTGRNFDAHVSGYAGRRGMHFERDVHDWLGGYPYESTTPGEVDAIMTRLAFERVRSTLVKRKLGLLGTGCDEYVYRRITAPSAHGDVPA